MTVARAELSLPFDPTTPSVARTKLAGFLTVNRVSAEIIDDALIVLSEMIANAVAHGGPNEVGELEVMWEITDLTLHLKVADGGSGAKLKALDFDEDSLSGRGLGIINKVADRWWVEEQPSTSVHAELKLR